MRANNVLGTAALLATTALALAPAGQALWVQGQGLTLGASAYEAKVGDTIDFTVQPLNASEAARFGGQTVVVNWSGMGRADDSSEAAPAEGTAVAGLPLSDKATATFKWTIPASAQDQNLIVSLMKDGQILGSAHIRIGDAPPMMFMTGGGPADTGGPVDTGNPVPETTSPPPGAAQGNGTAQPPPTTAPKANTPGFETTIAGLGLLIAGVALLALRRK